MQHQGPLPAKRAHPGQLRQLRAPAVPTWHKLLLELLSKAQEFLHCMSYVLHLGAMLLTKFCR